MRLPAMATLLLLASAAPIYGHGDPDHLDLAASLPHPPVQETTVENVRWALRAHAKSHVTTFPMDVVPNQFAGFDDGEAMLRELLADQWAEDPDNSLAWKLDAGLHLWHERHADALASLERAARRLSSDFEVHYYTGLIHYLAGDTDRALAAFKLARKFEDVDSQNWEAVYLHTAQIHAQRDELGKAQRVVRQYLATRRADSEKDYRYVAATTRMLTLVGEGRRAVDVAETYQLDRVGQRTRPHARPCSVNRALAFAGSTLPRNRARLLRIGELEPGHTLIGEPAPDFEATTAEGNVIRLSDYRGRAVLLAFAHDGPEGWRGDWLSGPPSRIEGIHRRHVSEGLAVVRLHANGESAHSHAADADGIPTIVEAEAIRDDYHARGRTTVVIDRNGIVRDWAFNWRGVTEWDVETRVVEALRGHSELAAAR